MESYCLRPTGLFFCRAQGGFGGERGSAPILPEVLEGHDPLWSGTAHTTKEQALLYRLSGDTNPLHVDPVLAQKWALSPPSFMVYAPTDRQRD